MIISKVTLADIPALQKVARDTFFESFKNDTNEADMAKYLEESFATEKLTAELLHEGSEFYFALLDGEVIAYLKLNIGEAQTEHLDLNALEIERIYISAAHQGKGLGQLLYEKAMQMADEMQASYVWLGVWEHNAGAIRFYARNGFVPFHKHVFRLGADEQTDILMKRSRS